MIFAEMCIKTNNYCTVLLTNYNTKVFKKAEYVVIVAKQNPLELLAGMRSVTFAIACVVYLLGCCCLGVLHKLYCTETLTLLTLIAQCFSNFIDKTFSIALQSTLEFSLYM
jgi:hypothetical protein